MSEIPSETGEDVFQIAQRLSEQGERDAHVAELLSDYVKLRPDHGFAWFLYGDALRSVGRLNEAEMALTRALDLAPKKTRFAVYARIGMLARRCKGPREAEKWYRLATAEPACPGWMWLSRGANLVDIESFRQAVACLQAALAADDVDREEAFLNLALVARAERRYEEARGFVQKALDIDPSYVEAKRLLASLEGVEDVIGLPFNTDRKS